MSASSLSPMVAAFIRANLDSVEQLEILLLMRLQGGRGWTAEQLAREMRTSRGSVETRLVGLSARGLVSPSGDDDGACIYSPRDKSVDDEVAALAAAYLTRRFAVIEAIAGNPNAKIHLFADAFRVRKGNDE